MGSPLEKTTLSLSVRTSWFSTSSDQCQSVRMSEYQRPSEPMLNSWSYTSAVATAASSELNRPETSKWPRKPGVFAPTEMDASVSAFAPDCSMVASASRLPPDVISSLTLPLSVSSAPAFVPAPVSALPPHAASAKTITSASIRQTMRLNVLIFHFLLNDSGRSLASFDGLTIPCSAFQMQRCETAPCVRSCPAPARARRGAAVYDL